MTYCIRQTDTFSDWLRALRDGKGKVAIMRRLDRVRAENLGDVKSVGDGVSEMRVDVGPGYRLYFTQRGDALIVLCAGDKSSQSRDIVLAKKLAGDIE